MTPLQRHLSVRTRISIGPRDPQRFPGEDDDLGRSLLALVEGAIEEQGKLPRPSLLAFRPEQVEQYDLRPVVKSDADVHRFISAVAGQPGIEAVSLLGVLGVRFGRAPMPTPAVVAFVEWPDCRWWSAVRPLEERALREDWPALLRSAVEGYPRPGGMGGWFSRARREQLQLRVGSSAQPGLGMVH
jgi:hypothetical protein